MRPIERGDITAYKLPATTQVASGLFTVGVGSGLYLELQVNHLGPDGQAVGSDAAAFISATSQLQGTDRSSDSSAMPHSARWRRSSG